MGIVVISSEVKELLTLTHRVLVMRDHRVVAEFASVGATEEEVLMAATGAGRGGARQPPA